MGEFSLQLNSTGDYNTASGFYALRENTIGALNTAKGVMLSDSEFIPRIGNISRRTQKSKVKSN